MTRLGEGISYGTVQGEVVRREKGEDGGGGVKKEKKGPKVGSYGQTGQAQGWRQDFRKGGGGPSKLLSTKTQCI